MKTFDVFFYSVSVFSCMTVRATTAEHAVELAVAKAAKRGNENAGVDHVKEVVNPECWIGSSRRYRDPKIDAALDRMKELEEEYVKTPAPRMSFCFSEDSAQERLEYQWWYEEVNAEYEDCQRVIGRKNTQTLREWKRKQDELARDVAYMKAHHINGL